MENRSVDHYFSPKNKQHKNRHEQISKRKKIKKKTKRRVTRKDSKGKFRHKSRQECSAVNGLGKAVNKEKTGKCYWRKQKWKKKVNSEQSLIAIAIMEIKIRSREILIKVNCNCSYIHYLMEFIWFLIKSYMLTHTYYPLLTQHWLVTAHSSNAKPSWK